jgi:hypothetical protein
VVQLFPVNNSKKGDIFFSLEVPASLPTNFDLKVVTMDYILEARIHFSAPLLQILRLTRAVSLPLTVRKQQFIF